MEYLIDINNNIEKEEGNENLKIEKPFDPNDISINIVPRTIGVKPFF